jgi:hypothetical protein
MCVLYHTPLKPPPPEGEDRGWVKPSILVPYKHVFPVYPSSVASVRKQDDRGWTNPLIPATYRSAVTLIRQLTRHRQSLIPQSQKKMIEPGPACPFWHDLVVFFILGPGLATTRPSRLEIPLHCGEFSLELSLK